MGSAVQAKTDARPTVCQKKVLRTDRRDSKTECLFTDGTSILLSNFLASFVRVGDELLFPLDPGAVGANTEIYIRRNREERRQGIFHAQIGYVSVFAVANSALCAGKNVTLKTACFEFNIRTIGGAAGF